MGNIFAGSEIVEIGIQIEKNGKDFYDILSEKSKNNKAKEIFQYLAGEEEKHIKAFQKVLDSVAKYEPPEAYPGEYFAYMNALAGEYVFTQKNKGKQAAKNTKNDAEALTLGIGFEKDSIIFYEGMKTVVPEYELNLIDKMIKEEQKHLRKLIELKKSV